MRSRPVMWSLPGSACPRIQQPGFCAHASRGGQAHISPAHPSCADRPPPTRPPVAVWPPLRLPTAHCPQDCGELVANSCGFNNATNAYGCQFGWDSWFCGGSNPGYVCSRLSGAARAYAAPARAASGLLQWGRGADRVTVLPFPGDGCGPGCVVSVARMWQTSTSCLLTCLLLRLLPPHIHTVPVG